MADVSKVINRWPAIMFAANRIARVKGRIIFLIVSITTIKGIKIVGVPFGIKWINKLDVLNSHPCIIIPNHKGRAIIRVIDIWEVAVKIKGNRPGKLFNRIKIKTLKIKIIVWGLFLFNGLNSEKI